MGMRGVSYRFGLVLTIPDPLQRVVALDIVEQFEVEVAGDTKDLLDAYL